MKGRISKIGSYAISSSIKDHHQQPCISCTTFNILAPIYKRLSPKVVFLLQNQRRFILLCLFMFWMMMECRIKASVKAITERIGWGGIIESLIGYCTRGLPLYVCRFLILFPCSCFDNIWIGFLDSMLMFDIYRSFG